MLGCGSGKTGDDAPQGYDRFVGAEDFTEEVVVPLVGYLLADTPLQILVACCNNVDAVGGDTLDHGLRVVLGRRVPRS